MRSLVLCLVTVLLLGCASRPQEITPAWVHVGDVEALELQAAFTIYQTVEKEPLWILTTHDLVQVSRNDDGTFSRSYRKEPCLLWIDFNHDGVFTPEERRWKVNTEHVCPVTQLPGSIRMSREGEAIGLTYFPNKKEALDLHVLTVQRKVEMQSQLPVLE